MLIAAAIAPLLACRWGRLAFYPLATVPAASLLCVGLNWPRPGHTATVDLRWAPKLSLNITLRFDPRAAIMAVLVLGIGALVLLYCAHYFHHHDEHREQRLPSFTGELVAFAGAMFGLVVSDNMVMLYVFWELTTVLSFLLVGHYAQRATSRRAAMAALLVTTAGGLAMLAGIVILGQRGSALALTAAIGIVRFPDTLSRMHAATKPQVLGLLLVLALLAGAAVRLHGSVDVGMIVLTGMFTLITAPVVAHCVGRHAYRQHAVREDLLTVDELREDVEGYSPDS